MKPKQTNGSPSQRRAGKLVQHLTIRPVLRLRIIGASLLVLLTVGLVIFFNVSNNRKIKAAVSGDYRTRASGNWNSLATWSKYNGASWVNATVIPSSTDGAINILTGHTVTLTANATVDQTTIDAGGALVITSGKYLYENNGTGTDLTVNGTLTVNSGGYLTENASSKIDVNGTIIIASGGIHQFNTGCTISINNGGRYRDDGGTVPTTAGYWTVNSGGVYQHNRNSSSLPLATWNSGSTCEITGVTNGTPGNLTQSFQNFTWDCPTQSANTNFNGAITSIGGNLTIGSTNASQLQLASAGFSATVSGNFIQSGGTFALSTSASANPTLNIAGDFIQSGGTFSVVTGNNVTGNVNVSGNWTRTGGTITVGGNSNTNAQFFFNKTGSQTFSTSGATVSGNVDFTVNNGSILVMGNNILTGRNFTLSAGGELNMGSAAGITASSATGNIQATTTRSYNTDANYTYNGTAAQNSGDGLPATVRNLTLTNSNDLTLTNSVAVSNVLYLTSGNLITGSNEVKTTNTSATSIQGYSSSNYVIGNLRRSVTGTGIYDFPLGTASNYELATLSLTGMTGFTDVVGSFTNATPIAAGYPLSGLLLSNLLIDKVLSYGYWTLTPNSVMLGGTYGVTLYETGNSVATGPAYSYCVIKRTNTLTPWVSTGTHVQGTSSGATLSAGRTGLTLLGGDFALGYGQYLGFKGVTLTSGTNGQAGAVYKFPDVCYNVDCWISIVSVDGGAVLSNVDNFTTGNGYDEAWQPYIDQPANSTSSILWRLTFKVAGTSTDTSLAFLAITGVDIDGGTNLREFVEATMPKSYAISSPSSVTVTNNSGNYRATSTTSTSIANIDTGQYQAMYQINYQNLNSFLYRTGAINTSGVGAVRQHSLYFKSFMTAQLGLPIKLTYFKARLNKNDQVDLSWATSSEINNDHFTVERSSDNENFETILSKPGAGNSSVNRYYSAVDENPLPGTSYYRLKQTDYDGHCSYSETQTVKYKTILDESSLKILSVAPNPFSEKFTVSFQLKTSGVVNLRLINSSGQPVYSEVINATEGMNQYEFTDKMGLQRGIYFLDIIYNDEKQVQKIVKN